MKRLAKLDRLVEELSKNIFVDVESCPGLTVSREGEDALRPATPDLVWGEAGGRFLFAGEAELPPAPEGCRVVARVEAAFGATMGSADPQCLVRVDGRVVQAVDANHRYFSLAGPAGARRRIEIEAGTIEDRRQLGFAVRLQIHDLLAEKLWFDVKIPLDVVRLLKVDDARALAILDLAEAALDAIDFRPGDPARFRKSLRAAEAIAGRIYALAKTETDLMPTVVASGHTHIDVAWLWRTAETRRKMARSMATTLALMDEYPDYRFMYNQAVLFDWLSEDQPELFSRLKEKVAEGSFEVEGALWLEPDVNLASGESLVRQLIAGIAYHERTFGVRPRLLWLPDTFGYSAALPQLMALSGLSMFVTHKLSWNDTDRMPHDTFLWQGIDGTRVPTSFVTTQAYEYDGIETTYCADLRASHILGTWKRHSDKARQGELFMIYGHGDGGGGPTREMVETLRRFERGIPGAPKVRQGALGPHFARLADRMRAAPEAYPSWVGELYLECHRGTLTSVAKVKRNNRRAEVVLRELELLDVLAVRAGTPSRAEEIASLWKIALLNQFHDILPGSSIGAVYEDSEKEYAELFARARALERDYAAALGGGPMLLNASGRRRGGLVAGLAGEGAQIIVRADGSNDWLSAVRAVPGNAVAAIVAASWPVDPALAAEPGRLENARLRVLFDGKGRIVSLYDKARGREVLLPGELGNRLVAYRDMPPAFDAWDIDASFEDKFWEIDDLVSAEVVETGPLRAAIRVEWAYERSRLVEVLSLDAGSDRLEIDGFLDWHEHHTLVKMHMPVCVRADESRAEIQFGHVRRPTHANTSWDAARFETSMRRWVDLSEEGFGLAVLNDCKHGYDARGTRLRITLLRSPTYPWPDADQGEHRFRLALMPHGGFSTDGATIISAAEDLDMPLRLIGSGEGRVVASSPFALGAEGVFVAAAKRAEDGHGTVVRLYEARGRRERVLAQTDAATAAIVDLLERRPMALPVEGGAIALDFAPFEIKTLLLGD